MPIIRTTKKEPTLIRLAGAVLTVSGILFFSSGNHTLAIIAPVIGLGMLISSALTTSIEINTDQKTYRKRYSLFSIIFGDWESLPKTEYLSIYKARTVITSSRSLAPPLTAHSYIIYSFFEDRKPIVLHKTDNRKEGFETANLLASALHVGILDTTSTEQRWL